MQTQTLTLELITRHCYRSWGTNRLRGVKKNKAMELKTTMPLFGECPSCRESCVATVTIVPEWPEGDVFARPPD